MDKLLSIIIPSYNMEQYLPKCCDSLLIDDKELFDKLDVIIVNDGSTDRTSEIAHSYEAKYPNVFRVIDKPNGHYGSCINAGLPEARGEFVKVLDADDRHDTFTFRQYLAFLKNVSCDAGREEIDFILMDYSTVREDGSIISQTSFPFSKENFVTPVDFERKRCQLMAHAVAYRTSMLMGTGYRQSEGIPYTDTEWIFAPMAKSRKGRYFPKTVYLYTFGREGQSVSAESWLRNIASVEQLLDRMLSTYDKLSVEYLNHSRYLEWRICSLVKHLFGSYAILMPFLSGCSHIHRLGKYASRYKFLASPVAGISMFDDAQMTSKFRHACFRYPLLVYPIVAAIRIRYMFCRIFDMVHFERLRNIPQE